MSKSKPSVVAGLLLLSLSFGRHLLAQEASPPCEAQDLYPDEVKGEQSRFLATPPARAKELAVDSMMVLGFVVTDENENKLEATRKYPELGGPSKTVGEKLYVRLEPTVESGVPGTRVFMESRKRAFLHKRWAVALLGQAECLHGLLDEEESATHADGAPVFLPEGTQIRLRLRRYLFSKTAKVGDVIVLQTSGDTVIGGVTVIRKGAKARGRIEDLTKAKSFERAAGIAFAIESVKAVDGTEVALRADETQLKGKSRVAAALFTAGIFGGLFRGDQVGIRAGTELLAAVAEDNHIRSGSSE